MAPEKYYAETYDIQTVSKFCQIAGIDPSNAPHARQELEHFAAIYRWEHARTANKAPGKATKRELESLANQTARLLEILAKLSPDAAAAIERQVAADARLGIARDSGAPNGPSLFIRLDDFSDDLMGLSVNLEMLQAVLGGLHDAASTGADTTHKSRSGKTQDFGLLLWLSNIKTFWHAHTDLPFSRDVTQTGEPITNAGSFCLAAFLKIEPDCPTSRVMNGMKYVIKKGNKSTGKIRA
ncbi:hypothetical protein SAMN05444414_14221 [Roseovarius marisflavi]|uniref:Uncharacterized protein n=1 Tax=Roseovarius marisflavi TaxID=1054996 RepID=A0A1M7DJM9_9RHOB|nr:hypothetical protein [Roseovarius marisflavi]SHL79731.1 hypothetical protein SAMN05444414_14221 [Roseovarius marisflavi]